MLTITEFEVFLSSGCGGKQSVLSNCLNLYDVNNFWDIICFAHFITVCKEHFSVRPSGKCKTIPEPDPNESSLFSGS